MIVTINTDASYSPVHKVGAYAFYIICNEGKIMMSGALKEAKGATDAELRCIANALHVVLHSQFTKITKIIINSDALYAFGMVGLKKEVGPGRKVAQLLKELKRKYRLVQDFHKPIHEFRHVKAHKKVETKREWVNDWCDKQAKKELKKQYPK